MLVLPAAAAGTGVVAAYFGLAAYNGRAVGGACGSHGRGGTAGRARAAAERGHTAVARGLRGGDCPAGPARAAIRRAVTRGRDLNPHEVQARRYFLAYVVNHFVKNLETFHLYSVRGFFCA